MSGDLPQYKHIGEFLEEEYEKFAIMGIFGTVSVFLISNFPANAKGPTAHAGTVASLVIFLFVTAWIFTRATSLLFESLEELPLETKLGYLIIITCTATLGLAIGSLLQTQSYTTATRELTRIVLFAAGVLTYLHFFPTDRYIIDSGDSETGPSIIVPAVVLAGLFHIVLQSGIHSFLRNITTNDILIVALYPWSLAGLHLTFSEAFRGYFAIHSRFKELRGFPSNLLPDSKLSFDKIQLSVVVLFTVIAVFLLSLSVGNRAAHDIGAGRFWIGGKGWKEWILLHWTAVVLLTSFLIYRSIEEEQLKQPTRFLQSVLALLGVISLIEIILLYLGILGRSFPLL